MNATFMKTATDVKKIFGLPEQLLSSFCETIMIDFVLGLTTEQKVDFTLNFLSFWTLYPPVPIIR
jgi:hypothetical protein